MYNDCTQYVLKDFQMLLEQVFLLSSYSVYFVVYYKCL